MKMVAACALMCMALVTGADIVCRAGFNMPIFGSEEIVTFLAVLGVGFALPYTHAQGSNIGVEVLYRRFKRRTRNRIKLCTDLAGAALFGVVAWRMVLYGLTLERVGEVSMTLEFPSYWLVHTLAVGFAVLALLHVRDALGFFGSREGEE